MEVIRVVNDLSGGFDHQVVNQGVGTVHHGDSVGRRKSISVSCFLKLELHFEVSVLPVVEGGTVVYRELITVLVLVLANTWSSDYVVQLEPHQFIPLQVFV